jgi:putative addiction module killer protein
MSEPKAANQIQVRMLDDFADWLKKQKDMRLKAKIQSRLNQVQGGNLGDHHSLRGGVSELRMRSGHRLYYTMRGMVVLILLCAGNKSGQNRDIEKAIELNKGVGL